VFAHIEAEEVVLRKNDNSHSRQPRPKESSQARPLRVNETSFDKRMNSRYVPYVARKDEPKMKEWKSQHLGPSLEYPTKNS